MGASCPPDRLAPLVAMLRPEGGLIVVPVRSMCGTSIACISLTAKGQAWSDGLAAASSTPSWLSQFPCPPVNCMSALLPCPATLLRQVAPNDLRVITKRPNGTVTQKVEMLCCAAVLDVAPVHWLPASAPSELPCHALSTHSPPPCPSNTGDQPGAVQRPGGALGGRGPAGHAALRAAPAHRPRRPPLHLCR